MKLTVDQLERAAMRDPAAVPRLARALGLRGDAPLDVVSNVANGWTFGIATHWLNAYSYRERLAAQEASP